MRDKEIREQIEAVLDREPFDWEGDRDGLVEALTDLYIKLIREVEWELY